jgi:cysteinyl-tRNA synthetase
MFGNPRSVLARLVANGFDGAYLDRVDIWQFWCGERASSFEDIVSFVEALSASAKRQRPGFMIVPQNGEELLAVDRYRGAIDGVGKEDFFFGDRGNDVMNYDTRVELEVELFAHAHRGRIPVFAIEYARDPKNHVIAKERHAAFGHVVYFGPRSLAYIGQAGPLHKEDGDSEPYYATRGRRNCKE